MSRQLLGGDWPLVPLGEVCTEAKTGFASGERTANGVIQVRMNNVDTRGHLVWTSLTRVPADPTTINQYRLCRSDVLFNNTNSTALVGKSAIFEGHEESVVYSNHFTRLRTAQARLLPSYLAWWLNYEWRRGTFASVCNRWIGQSAVKPEKLLALKIPLPPLSEQERIARGLSESLASVDASRRAADERLAAAEALPSAYLREVFESGEGKRWTRVTVNALRESGALVEHQDGNHGELHPRNKDFVASGVRFVTAKHLGRNGELKLHEAPFISREQASSLRIGFAKTGDLLLAHNATVGPIGMAPSNCEPFVVGTSLTIYRPKADALDAGFLYLALRSDEFQSQLLDAMKQTTRNQVPITRQRDFRLPLPEISVQRNVAVDVARRLLATETLIARCNDLLAIVADLPSSLLRAAFSGGS